MGQYDLQPVSPHGDDPGGGADDSMRNQHPQAEELSWFFLFDFHFN